MKTFYDLLHYGIRENLHYLYEDPANLSIIGQQHTEIFQGIKDHDPEAAYAAMHTAHHLCPAFLPGAADARPLPEKPPRRARRGLNAPLPSADRRLVPDR